MYVKQFLIIMKKLNLTIIASGAILLMGSCSADNIQDEPQTPATEVTDMASSLPSLKSERDISWLRNSDKNIVFEISELPFPQDDGVTAFYCDYNTIGGSVTLSFGEELQDCRLAGAWVKSEDNLETVAAEDNAKSLEIPSVGVCHITDSEVTFTVCSPKDFKDGIREYTIGIYVQGVNEGKVARGLICATITESNGSSMFFTENYEVVDSDITTSGINNCTLVVPSEGGKISLRLNQPREVEWIGADTSANESLTYDKASEGAFCFFTPMAQYRVEEKTGRMEINVSANDTGVKRYDKLDVIVLPTREEKELNPCLESGRAIINIVQL